jgi:hypothetical protein
MARAGWERLLETHVDNREVTMHGASGALAAWILGLLVTILQAGSPLSVRWIGQDGHDYVGPNNRLEPSEIQDVHLLLGGLDPAREVAFIDVTTEQQKDQWQYNARSFSWKAELKRSKGSRTADLFIEPGHVVTPQRYHILIRYDDGTTRELDFRSQKVSPGLRMPGAAMRAKWLGQDRKDRVATGPAVGPDGLQDARIRLSGISKRIPVKAMRIDGPSGLKWESGPNRQRLSNAEFWPDPKNPTEGDLFFQPERDLKGQKLQVRVLYANETMDAVALTAGRCDPKLRMPEPTLPRVQHAGMAVSWLGQDGQDLAGPGSVHVRLAARTRIATIAGAVLTDAVRGTWVVRSVGRGGFADPPGEQPGPMVLKPGADGTSLDLFFAPYRDETGAMMTLRLMGGDGRSTLVRFPGEACDPSKRAPQPDANRVEAHPGDDLPSLVQRGGTIALAPGEYRLSRPLVLDKPVALTGDGKARLVFSQGTAEPPWTSAIKIHCGHTMLNGFSVRFEGPVRWEQDVSYGPAVIGTTDSRDQGHSELKVGLILTRLDLEIPPAADPSKWVEALRLMRLTNAEGGMIAGNVLRGGPIEFFDGPWQILNNDFRGTPPGTFSHGVFAGHGTHDVVIKGNRARPVAPDGKTWRFLVLTHRGANDRVENNVIEGLGSLEGDTIPWSNEPEIMLTEGYHLSYEGRVAGLSADGLLLKIHEPQGQPVETGDVVSLLSGPAAAQFRRVAQVIDPTAYVLDAPIPKGTEAVAISRGFVNEVFEKNRIDVRGGRRSDGLVFVGNHFGTRIEKNELLGGAFALRLTACPSETPVVWGWSHAPYLGGVVADNLLEDAEKGSVLSVEHAAKDIKSSTGRVYMSVALERNVVRWSDAFLKRLARDGAKAMPPGLVLGDPPVHDASEFVVKASGNRLEAPAGVNASSSLTIHGAVYNTRKVLNRNFALPREAAETRQSERARPAGASSLPSRR